MTAVSFGRHAAPVRTLIHLSDTHLLADDALLAGRIDTERNLDATIARMARISPAPDALIVTGDLTDLGEPAAYTALRARLEPFAQSIGAELIWVAGNHDERPALHQHLLDAEPTQAPVISVTDVRGLRVLVLDSSVPGWHHGSIDDAQLAWLRDMLSTAAPLGTLLALHHPPLPSHVPLFDILELQRQDELAAVIRGTDVRGILAGHLHYSTSGTFAGIPVSVASATCYSMDLAAESERVNGMNAGQSFHLVHVWEDTITHSVVPVASAEITETFTPEWYEAMRQLSPRQRQEIFSRKPERAEG